MVEMEMVSANDALAELEGSTELKKTGIRILDRNLGGGLPAGSTVYFSADPRSMSEVFLYQFTQARPTYYFCTERRPVYIAKNIKELGFGIDGITFIDVYSEYYLNQYGEMVDNVGNEFVDSKIIEFVEYNLNNILTENKEENKDINVVFDTFSFFLDLNVNLGKIKRLVNILYEMTKETNALSFLYAMKGTHDKVVEHEIMNASDVIFDVDLERKGDKISSKLAIPKIRGMVPATDLIKFKVSDGVQIDTSRDIA